MPRYPSVMLAACPTAWDEDWRLDEHHFRREVQMVIEAGFEHLYVFGTGSEGYAIDSQRFARSSRVLARRRNGHRPDGRRHRAFDAQYRGTPPDRLRHRLPRVPVSLPSWGPLNDDEVMTFFTDVCGTFPDAQFLHYNLPRTKRVLTGPSTPGSSPKSQIWWRRKTPPAACRSPASCSATRPS